MPFYDYKCDGCGHQFEENHAMSAPPITVCPSCGAEKVRKLLTTGGILGSGKTTSGSPPPPMPSCPSGGCGGGMCGMG